MAQEVDNMQDVLDSRNIIARIEELEEELADPTDKDRPSKLDEEDKEELKALKELEEEAKCSPD